MRITYSLISCLCQFMFWVIFYSLCYLALIFCELIKRFFFDGQCILLRYIIPSSIEIFYELNPFPWRPWITMVNKRGQFHAMLLRHFPFTNKSKVYIVVCVCVWSAVGVHPHPLFPWLMKYTCNCVQKLIIRYKTYETFNIYISNIQRSAFRE